MNCSVTDERGGWVDGLEKRGEASLCLICIHCHDWSCSGVRLFQVLPLLCGDVCFDVGYDFYSIEVDALFSWATKGQGFPGKYQQNCILLAVENHPVNIVHINNAEMCQEFIVPIVSQLDVNEWHLVSAVPCESFGTNMSCLKDSGYHSLQPYFQLLLKQIVFKHSSELGAVQEQYWHLNLLYWSRHCLCLCGNMIKEVGACCN
jgi:hypothetical protein